VCEFFIFVIPCRFLTLSRQIFRQIDNAVTDGTRPAIPISRCPDGFKTCQQYQFFMNLYPKSM